MGEEFQKTSQPKVYNRFTPTNRWQVLTFSHWLDSLLEGFNLEKKMMSPFVGSISS